MLQSFEHDIAQGSFEYSDLKQNFSQRSKCIQL